jgi:uncharacterized protein (DUF952 family)
MYIFHITSTLEWMAAQPKSDYRPANFAADGFIHCSFKDQVVPVANKFYRSGDHLVLLKIDTDLLKARVIEENLEGGEENFPHIYGPLPITAVVKFAEMQLNKNNYFEFPAQLA